MQSQLEPQVRRLLAGAIDMHIHSAPDLFRRILNDMELAREAQEAGMRAILIKNHFGSTAERAQLATAETGFPVYGAIVLNHTVGGLNPHAVDYALKMGARVIWLPTLHARQFLENRDHVESISSALGEGLEGLCLLNNAGRLKQVLYPIFDLIAQRDAVLATGHIGVAEARVVVREAAERGVAKIVVTHPLASFLGYTTEEMKEMLDLGASYIEHVYNDTTHHVGHPISIETLYEGIKAIGAAHCIMATDAGQWLNPMPVRQFGTYIHDMLALGLSEQEIRAMAADNPARALGI